MIAGRPLHQPASSTSRLAAAFTRSGRSWRRPRSTCTLVVCAEASRPCVAPMRPRRRANWRPPPASTSARSAASASRAARNREAFDAAIAEIAAASDRLLETLGVDGRGGPDRWTPGPPRDRRQRLHPRARPRDRSAAPLGEAPQLVTRSISIRMSGRSSRWCVVVLRVLGRGARRRPSPCPARRRSRAARPALAAQPGEPRPVLVPAVDEDRDPRVAPRCRGRGRGPAGRRSLRLVVERRVEDGSRRIEHEADRDEPRPAVGPIVAEDGASRGVEERALRRRSERGSMASPPIDGPMSRASRAGP